MVALLVLLADQATKAWAQHVVGPHRYIPIAGEVLGIRLAMNRGAAFGLFTSGGPLLVGTAVVAVAIILYYSRRAGHLHPWMLPAFALQLGGALGNLLDRIRLGSVVDFIYLSFWPTFNVADIALTLGGMLLGYCLITARPEGEPREKQA